MQITGPPAGVSLEAWNAQTLRTNILVGTWLCFSIASVFVFLRLYSRFVVAKNPGIDDVLVFIT